EPKASDRTLERHPTENHGHRRARYGDDVERVHVVYRQDRRDHLDLVTEALRERRAKGAVGETSGEDRRLRCTSFSTEETAWDLPRRVHAFFDVDGQREEVELLFRLRRCDRGDENL